MKSKYFILLFLMLLVSCSNSPKTHFDIVETLVKDKVLNDAEKFLDLEPITVTAHTSKRSAGTKHDFYSEGDYWWPNPEDPNGPYIRKDGLSNPDNFVAHRRSMIRLSQISGALASAYLITKDDVYLQNLMPHLKAWFVDDGTKMNPHLLYAQAIKGRVTGRGIGIIDTIHLIEVSLAVEVIEDSYIYNKEDIIAIKDWFSKYLNWLTTHEYGIKERDNGNNHSTCWAMQVAAFARLVGNKEQMLFCKNLFKKTLLPEQMAKDGSFPKELARTKPYGYSIFNLDAMTGLAQLLTSKEENIFKYVTKDGKSLKLGMQFLYPYLNDKNTWPFKKDVMHWDEWPTKQPSLLFAGLQFQQNNYIETWAVLPQIPNNPEIVRNMPIRYPLLWVKE
ncbi:alginate lyase [Hyunsoonleella flava]|uniref:Alginate lyase n=1 Tax=Hyunsoonleella flava TaxID=2527939 RepID=A0A4Q9FD00_9FLAO|nr:alginate lyase family protein [Hyunsoonleella flava]TBN03673.1 alginate lyase [Hyunsoonleella flava]